MSLRNYLFMALTALALGVVLLLALGEQCPKISDMMIPPVQTGQFGIALVVDQTIKDHPWEQSHVDGLLFLRRFVDGSVVHFLEGVPENCDTTGIFRELSLKGYRLIIGAGIGYMGAMEKAAGEFEETTFINVLGLKANRLNFDNLNGAMEDMVYLAGMLAGARAREDNAQKLGFVATLPVPEELRMINAAALGMRKTCPECTMDVRWMYDWRDDPKEAALARGLFEAGAHVVFSGASGSGLKNALQAGKYIIPIGSSEQCTVSEACLTAAYWNWGPVYLQIAGKVKSGDYRPQSLYFHADSNGLGLYGFMQGEALTLGAADLPPEDLAAIYDRLSRMADPAQQAWREVFAGPIQDNQGRTIVEEGGYLTRISTDQFPPGGQHEECEQPACMYWFAAGINSDLPDIGKARK